MVWRVAFAVLVSSSAFMILVAWVTGSASNPLLTASLLAVPAVVMIAAARFSKFRVNLIDILFGLFVAAMLISTALNGLPPARDAVLFVLSLLAYPAGRLARVGITFRPFVKVTGLVVAIGTFVVGVSLVGQWNDPHGRPIVFGLAHAGPVFLSSLGFL